MAKKRKKLNIFIVILLYLFVIIVAAILASLITFLILLAADAVLYEKKTWQTAAYHRNQFMERINWTFAAVVFVGTFLVLTISAYLKDLNKKTRDENLLVEMNLNASQLGENPQAFADDDSFVSAFTNDATKFEGRFYVQTLPQKGGDQRTGVASVSFKVNGCKEDFYIEQKEKYAESDLESYSITPLSENNATQKLDGKYSYDYSNYRFFNSFLADDEIIQDLLESYEKYGEKIAVKLKNQEFLMECRKEVSSDEDLAQEDTSELLKSMNIRARKYYRRFQVLGLI
jgi:hypothetical protein